MCAVKEVVYWEMKERTEFHQRDIKVFMQKFRRRTVQIDKDIPTGRKCTEKEE